MIAGMMIPDRGYQLLVGRKNTAAAMNRTIELLHFTSYFRQSV
jgi:hypothetical protein